MNWPSIERLTEGVPLPEGYKYALPTRTDIPALIQAVDNWFPGLAVGNASCYLREDFYANRVFFGDAHERDFFFMLFKHGDEWAGMLSVERDKDSQVLYGRVGTIAERHRGARLSKCFPPLMEVMGAAMGMGMVYSLATLKVPHMQVGFEKAGWQLIGIIPGFDRELIGPGDVKRVFEAIYVKVLVTESDFLRPQLEGMTPATGALFKHLFAGQLDGVAERANISLGTDTRLGSFSHRNAAAQRMLHAGQLEHKRQLSRSFYFRYVAKAPIAYDNVSGSLTVCSAHSGEKRLEPWPPSLSDRKLTVGFP